MLKSSGVFGLILVLIAVLVGVSIYSLVSINEPFNIVYDQLYKLDIVEDNYRYYFVEMRINEILFILFPDDKEYITDFQDSDAGVDEGLAMLDEGTDGYSEAEQVMFDKIEKTRSEYKQTFADMVSAGDDGDYEEMDRLKGISDSQGNLMLQYLAEFVQEIQKRYDEYLLLLKERAQQAILVTIIALILIPLLGLWALGMAGQITRPILTLTTAVTSMEGNQYRRELLEDTPARHDDIGKLSRDIDALAETFKSRQAALAQKVQEARDQLQESRRRKRISGVIGRDE